MVCEESPFIFEDAVPLDKFFNRNKEIDLLVRNLEVKRKLLLCIVAPLKYGKSSLMLKYLDILSRYDDIVPIYINLKVIEEPISYIVETLKKHDMDLSETFTAVRKRGILSELFQELDKQLKQKNKWLFLLFDEFHLLPSRVKNEGFLANFDDKDIFGFFRGYAEGRRISYIVCGSVIEPLMDALDVWGGRFQTIYLGPFEEKDSVEMLKKLFSYGGMEIDELTAKNIVDAAGHHPFYIQYMGHQIYSSRKIDRRTIIEAKEKLYEFLAPIFDSYIKKIYALGKKYLEALKKVINKEALSLEERIAAVDMLRMGILKPKNARYELVDPLFGRYVQQIIMGVEPTEVLIVGHWAERIVGNYLIGRGHIPYYSHDSRGAFDIYVRIRNVDVGIQVKYSSTGKIRLTESEAKRIIETAKEMKWTPIIALVSQKISFHRNIRAGEYSHEHGEDNIEKLL
ncbi:MAG: ATP-binding protein [Candidatus Njordarchaeota archaeon]